MSPARPAADGARSTGRSTIEDVAVAAEVSVATVSRALRGMPNVAISTRERVLAVAEDLGYRPDPAASRLAAGRSTAIAIAVPVLNGWYFSQVMAGVEAVCADAGYDLLVMGVAGDDERHAMVASTGTLERRVDGVIFVDVPLGASDARVFVERRLEVATVGFRLEQFDSVGIDDVAVGRMATEHLLDLGHRRIGVIEGLAENPRHFDVPGLRAEGCVAALADHGLALDPDLVVGGSSSIDGGHEAMVALLGRPDPPTAVFAMSDEMAFGAIKAAADLGVAVPADLSVVGVDDHDMAAILGLTTVHQSVADLGAQAARLLIERLAQPDRPVEHCRADVHLEIRSTTAPPATRS